MKYRLQSRDCCLAYALWQIGAINKKALKAYEQTFNCTWYTLTPWINKYVKELDYTNISMKLTVPYPTGNTTLNGRGIIILMSDCKTRSHAISYENGIVLDPEKTEERLSLEEYLKKYRDWEVYRICPISKRV